MTDSLVKGCMWHVNFQIIAILSELDTIECHCKEVNFFKSQKLTQFLSVCSDRKGSDVILLIFTCLCFHEGFKW